LARTNLLNGNCLLFIGDNNLRIAYTFVTAIKRCFTPMLSGFPLKKLIITTKKLQNYPFSRFDQEKAGDILLLLLHSRET
jgi:hypothetical protein